jgi:threonine synthase
VKDMFNDFAFRDRVRAGRGELDQLGAGAGAGGLLLHRRRQLGAPHRPVSFCVPTGNFGDIFAGTSPAHGPADREAGDRHEPERHPAPGAETGEYVPDGVMPSISPSMDIQVSSNFERALFDAYGRDGSAVAD